MSTGQGHMGVARVGTAGCKAAWMVWDLLQTFAMVIYFYTLLSFLIIFSSQIKYRLCELCVQETKWRRNSVEASTSDSTQEGMEDAMDQCSGRD